MIKILLNGVNGRLGQMLVSDIAATEGMEVVMGVDVAPDAIKNDFPVFASFDDATLDADIIIDFSRPAALHGLLDYAQKKNMGAVLATTGYTDTDKMMIAKYAGHVPLFYSANMSLGVNLQMALAQKAASVLHNKFDIEIVEKHHNLKVDSPSGTALSLAEAINSATQGQHEFVYGRHAANQRRQPGEIGIHAVRGGTVVGEHDILFLGEDEIIEINHRALSKQVFSQGALRAAQFIYGKPAALYSMQDIFADIF